ncbi:hypothetical protein [Streptomyces racemochromogenes]|uniref:hypothetical protein n=1 Tax=Streptomyces racemochromogenes TaxID=67353 RepID=UPI0035E61A7C
MPNRPTIPPAGDDRTNTALVLLATAFIGVVAVAHPALIPALTLAVAAGMAVMAFLKM